MGPRRRSSFRRRRRGREPAYPTQVVHSKRHVPVLQRRKVVAYFHGNGEDLADSIPMISLLRTLGVACSPWNIPGTASPAERPRNKARTRPRKPRCAGCARSRDRSRPGGAPGPVAGEAGVATEMPGAVRAARLILISPFTSVPNDGSAQDPVPPRSLVRHRFDNKEKPRVSPCPVLIIHGTEDEVVPFAMASASPTCFPHAQLAPIQAGSTMICSPCTPCRCGML